MEDSTKADSTKKKVYSAMKISKLGSLDGLTMAASGPGMDMDMGMGMR